MTDYTKTTNFTAKDALSSGDPNKKILGALFDTEYDDIVIAVATKANQLTSVGATHNLMKTDASGDLVEATSINDDGLEVAVATGRTFNVVDAGALELAGVSVSSTAAELNKLDGATVTTTELNLLSGLTGTVWTSDNDGAGSGLSADNLDGVSSASFLRSDTTDSFSSGVLTLGGTTCNITATNFQIDSTTVTATATEINKLAGAGTLWHSGNDGAASGLDADLLDAQHGSYYTNASNLSSGTVPSARLPSASTTAAGIQENAVNSENLAFTSTTRTVTPSSMSSAVSLAWLGSQNGAATTVEHPSVFDSYSNFANTMIIEGAVDLSSDQIPYIQLTDDDGATYETSGYRYIATGHEYDAGGITDISTQNNTATYIPLALGLAEGSTANYKVAFRVTVYDCGSSGYHYFTVHTAYSNTGVDTTNATIGGLLTATTALTGFRITSGSGSHTWRYSVFAQRSSV